MSGSRVQEFGVLHRGETAVARAVREAAAKQEIFEPWYDRCQLKNPCKCNLARGLEALFISEIASRAYQHIRAFHPDWEFNQCIYLPWTEIEGKCGFDLSIGYFSDSRRLRLMHKLQPVWCDESWSWNSNSQRQSAKHIFMLTKQFRDSGGQIRPYLSFTVCFCLHEYRRMGQYDIPPFEDRRRFVLVELAPLADTLVDDFDSKKPPGVLEVEHEIDAGKSSFTAYWRPCNEVETQLKVCDWPTFLATVGKF